VFRLGPRPPDPTPSWRVLPAPTSSRPSAVLEVQPNAGATPSTVAELAATTAPGWRSASLLSQRRPKAFSLRRRAPDPARCSSRRSQGPAWRCSALGAAAAKRISSRRGLTAGDAPSRHWVASIELTRVDSRCALQSAPQPLCRPGAARRPCSASGFTSLLSQHRLQFRPLASV
jgi:hypothetical protein